MTLPCPFCGCEHSEICNKPDPYVPNSPWRWRVCNRCDACGPMAETDEQVDAVWNRRVTAGEKITLPTADESRPPSAAPESPAIPLMDSSDATA